MDHNCAPQAGWQRSELSLVSAPAGRLLSSLRSHTPSQISVHKCTSISLFIWRLITTQLPASDAARRPPYISAPQISVVMDTFRLFSDECQCRWCKGKATELEYELRVYTGAHCLISDHMCSLFLVDPTDRTMKCISCGCGTHQLIVQITPSGAVERMCLIMIDASDFLPSCRNLPSDQLSAAPVSLDTMLARFDQLCELLGDTIREIMIGYFSYSSRPSITPTRVAEMMRGVRDQMPKMAMRRLFWFSACLINPGKNSTAKTLRKRQWLDIYLNVVANTGKISTLMTELLIMYVELSTWRRLFGLFMLHAQDDTYILAVSESSSTSPAHRCGDA
ncbi:hypothetical protein PHLGIDRAFT_471129 [Phlebiopsis gigantea 11061_1 CR5-6]|uniref:Uncharacterized protein n=1 Tax=Phlebiopsis gigantea (strain 11061_1 CR5-6) TaxID=745531 RepID=A0A0C3NLY6_PHLG1|nr:hypothetical protein PHLGIDRAFT_471129 [Phlebiopsis gigantea 11061_1 CR5-6]